MLSRPTLTMGPHNKQNLTFLNPQRSHQSRFSPNSTQQDPPPPTPSFPTPPALPLPPTSINHPTLPSLPPFLYSYLSSTHTLPPPPAFLHYPPSIHQPTLRPPPPTNPPLLGTPGLPPRSCCRGTAVPTIVPAGVGCRGSCGSVQLLTNSPGE